MSKPQQKTYSITVFLVEGIKQAFVITNRGGRLTKRNTFFPTPESALAWCRKHSAGLVYSPANPAHN